MQVKLLLVPDDEDDRLYLKGLWKQAVKLVGTDGVFRLLEIREIGGELVVALKNDSRLRKYFNKKLEHAKVFVEDL